MNTHDIELPPLPKASKMYDIPGYDEEELKDYARAAIEADRKRRRTAMSEKPVASIKTLARYEPTAVYIGTGEYVAECVRADDGDYYLAADVDAEIEKLQREVEEWKHVASAQAELHDEAEKCAEGLAKALAELITWIPTGDVYRRLGFDPEAPMLALKRAKLALGGRTEQ